MCSSLVRFSPGRLPPGVARAALVAAWVAGWMGLCAWVVWFAHSQAANPRQEAMRAWCRTRVRYLYQDILSSVSHAQSPCLHALSVSESPQTLFKRRTSATRTPAPFTALLLTHLHSPHGSYPIRIHRMALTPSAFTAWLLTHLHSPHGSYPICIHRIALNPSAFTAWLLTHLHSPHGS
ncbi:unnamed protein product [Closterium sp. Naga37s-1]|nr:unnamed protein product [Closterium sp. Naga37s-1]